MKNIIKDALASILKTQKLHYINLFKGNEK
jgi:hypothetical protein